MTILAPLMLLWAAALAMLFALLWNHYQLITYPALLDYYEGAMPAITEVITSGKNPYAFESQPAKISVYPPLYHYAVAPFSELFGNSLLVHRAISGVFILASVILCFILTLRLSGFLLSAFLVAVIFYAGLLYFSTPVASSNSIGVFFFLLTVALPWLGRFSYRSLIFAMASGIVAFYCKQYFLAALGYVCLYLFLYVSKQKALVLGFVSLSFFLGSLTLVQMESPYYLDDVVFTLRGIINTASSYALGFNQLVWFTEIYIGLVILLVVQWLRARHKNAHEGENNRSQMVGTGLSRPLLQTSLPYFWFCFFCSFIVIALVVGKNPGNRMTYLFQLMTPFFLIAVFSQLTKLNRPSWLQVLLIMYTMYTSYALLPTDFTYQEKGWERLEKVMADKAPVYATALALPVLFKSDQEIFNNGFGSFYYFSRFKPELFKRTSPGESSTEIWEKHVDKIHGYIKEKKFALVVLDPWTRIPETVLDDPKDKVGLKLLRRNYKVSESITVSLADRPGGGNYKLNVWIPRN